jgi:hypothetical protein
LAGEAERAEATGPSEAVAGQELVDEVAKVQVTVEWDRGGALGAAGVLKREGVVLIKDAIPHHQVEECARAVNATFEECCGALADRGTRLSEPFAFSEIAHRSKLRYDMQLRDGAPVADPPPWQSVLERVLGEDVVPLFAGAVLSAPGSADQPLHMDGGHLFQSTHGYEQTQNPPHCVNVFVPLVDITQENGPTEFWPGSHVLSRARDAYNGQTPSVKLAGQIGDIIIFDYRVVHRGLANRGTENRPLLYLTYARPWFRDAQNFPDEPLLAKSNAAAAGGFGSTRQSASKNQKLAGGKKKKRR